MAVELCTIAESNRDVLSVIYDPNGNAITHGELVDRLNETLKLNEQIGEIHQWYAVRWERLKDLIHDDARNIEDEACNIMANGTRNTHDPPDYARTLNAMQDEIARLKEGLEMIAQIIHGSTRWTRSIALAVLKGGDCRKLEDVEKM